MEDTQAVGAQGLFLVMLEDHYHLGWAFMHSHSLNYKHCSSRGRNLVHSGVRPDLHPAERSLISQKPQVSTWKRPVNSEGRNRT